MKSHTFRSIFLAIPLFFLVLSQSGCDKAESNMAAVTVQIDYLGAGGYYNDNIAGVPTGLSIGANGPYPVDPAKTYTIEYRADSNFPVITKTWSPTSGPWKIHCYVIGNVEYLQAVPGN